MLCALVCERGDEDDEKCRNGVPEVFPVDPPHVTNHECTNDHESTPGSPGGNAGENRSKEN